MTELADPFGVGAAQDVDELPRPVRLAALALEAHDRGEQLLGRDESVPRLGRLEARVAVAAGLGGLAEVPQQIHPPALDGLAEGEHGIQVLMLAALAGNIGDPAVRNRGTIGGSLANNDPSACYPAAALGSGATIVTDKREIPADDYFEGMFATALQEGEIITEVKFPVPQKAAYMKFEQPASRFALVGVFVAKYADGVRVAVTGASEEGVFRWSEAEAALASDFSAGAVEGLSLSGDGMISDLHGSGDYRAHLVGVMTKRAVAAAV